MPQMPRRAAPHPAAHLLLSLGLALALVGKNHLLVLRSCRPNSRATVYHCYYLCMMRWCALRRVRGQSGRQAAVRRPAQQLQQAGATGAQRQRRAHRAHQAQAQPAHRCGEYLDPITLSYLTNDKPYLTIGYIWFVTWNVGRASPHHERSCADEALHDVAFVRA